MPPDACWDKNPPLRGSRWTSPRRHMAAGQRSWLAIIARTVKRHTNCCDFLESGRLAQTLLMSKTSPIRLMSPPVSAASSDTPPSFTVGKPNERSSSFRGLHCVADRITGRRERVGWLLRTCTRPLLRPRPCLLPASGLLPAAAGRSDVLRRRSLHVLQVPRHRLRRRLLCRSSPLLCRLPQRLVRPQDLDVQVRVRRVR